MTLKRRRTVRETIVVAICLFFYSPVVYSVADDSATPLASKDHLLKLVKAEPSCDETAVRDQLKDVKIDEDVLFALATNSCMKPIPAGAVDPNTSLKVAHRIWDYWSQDYFPQSKRELQNGNAPAPSAVGKIISAVGVAGGIAQGSCDSTHSKDACALASEINANMQKQLDELNTLGGQANQTTLEAGCAKGTSNVFDCIALDKKKMRGTSRPNDWNGVHALHYRLTQFVDGFAVFADEAGEQNFLIAVKKSSLRTDLQPGSTLIALPELTNGKADCLKFLSDGTAPNQAGFSVEVMRFIAVKCLKH
jgi:hypothetical protein